MAKRSCCPELLSDEDSLPGTMFPTRITEGSDTKDFCQRDSQPFFYDCDLRIFTTEGIYGQRLPPPSVCLHLEWVTEVLRCSLAVQSQQVVVGCIYPHGRGHNNSSTNIVVISFSMKMPLAQLLDQLGYSISPLTYCCFGMLDLPCRACPQ